MPFHDTPPDTSPRADGSRFRAVELDRHLGIRLRFLRLASGWSQRDMAGRIGLTFQQVQKYESGANRVSAALLAELSGAFGLPMDWFAGPFVPAAPVTEPFAAIMDTLFRGLQTRRDEDIAAALDLVCTLARGASATETGRLGRLRDAMHASTPEEAAFLLQAAARIAGPGLPMSTGARGGGPGAVLLVDDDPDVRTMLSTALASAGFAVTAAGSGDEALAILSDRPIDVLISDYAMVGMDGVDLMAHARQLRPGLPGLMITGFADAGRLRELPPGIEVLSKPFRRMELVGRIRILLEQWGQPAAAAGMATA